MGKEFIIRVTGEVDKHDIQDMINQFKDWMEGYEIECKFKEIKEENK